MQSIFVTDLPFLTYHHIKATMSTVEPKAWPSQGHSKLGQMSRHYCGHYPFFIITPGEGVIIIHLHGVVTVDRVINSVRPWVHPSVCGWVHPSVQGLTLKVLIRILRNLVGILRPIWASENEKVDHVKIRGTIFSEMFDLWKKNLQKLVLQIVMWIAHVKATNGLLKIIPLN